MNKLIKVKNEFSQEEYMIIEMQGSISHTSENKFYNLNLGRIENISKVKFKKKLNQDKYKFIIGNHHILGEKENLKNPILVCKKKKTCDPKKPTNSENSEIHIERIIKSKIIFKSRPTPVISNPGLI